MQADRKRTHEQSNRVESTTPNVPGILPQHPAKRKRQARDDNEIDALFNASFGKKVKKAAMGTTLEPTPTASKAVGPESQQDRGLERVLGAIRVAPKDEKLHRKKKRK